MKKNILTFAAFAFVFALIGFILDQLIMYITLSQRFYPPLWPIATFFSGIIPGLFLGIAISLAFKHTHKKIKSKQYYMFILITAASTLLGYLLHDYLFVNNLLDAELGRFISMLIGAFSVVYGFHKYLFNLSQKQIIIIGLLGAIVNYLPFLINLPNIPFIFLLFLLYPITMASSLGWIAHRNKH
jgi:hypothetical protein